MSISVSQHADKANMGIMRDEEGSYIAYALRPIKKGEEVSCPFHNIPLWLTDIACRQQTQSATD